MKDRTAFPPVFWIANSVEVLERFAYYGIYMGFGIYMEYLGYTQTQLGIVQSIFLLFSYVIPVISGTLADRYGFKKILIISYLAYLPSILLLIITRSFSGIALTMLSIGLAAGIFKPLISGTVRAVTDRTNKTLGFGIFYAMVNVGATFGPIAAGKLRAISWNHAFIAAGIAIGIMLLVTILFYKEPKRDLQAVSLGQKMREILEALSDLKFLSFLIMLGIFFWLPFWAFFNLTALYIDRNLDTAMLFLQLQSVFGTGFAQFFSHQDESGTWRLLGETISQTGYIVMLFQVFVSRIFEKRPAIPTFITGMTVMSAGFVLIGMAYVHPVALIFAGIFFVAVGEMTASPRIQEYIMWIAPREKAGLYMGTNFLALGIGGALSGLIYTSLYGYFRALGSPDYIWYVLAANIIIGIFAVVLFVRKAGEFRELEA